MVVNAAAFTHGPRKCFLHVIRTWTLLLQHLVYVHELEWVAMDPDDILLEFLCGRPSGRTGLGLVVPCCMVSPREARGTMRMPSGRTAA